MYYIQGYLVSIATKTDISQQNRNGIVWSKRKPSSICIIYKGTWFPLQLILVYHNKTEPVLYGQNGNQVVYVLYTRVLGFHCNIDTTKTAILLKILKKNFLNIFSKKMNF